MRLTIVIPCYNEARSLPALVKRCAELVAADPEADVILVDNGSTDDSPAVLARELAPYPRLASIRVPHNQGYGHGILAGLAAARGDIIGWTHADLQTDPMDALAGLAHFRRTPDPARLFVKGQRFGRPLGDQLFTFGMSVFETLLFGRVLRDVNAQPNLLPRGFFESWRNPPHDFALDTYAYALAKADGLRVERFPVAFTARLHGQSHWNINWRAKLKFIKRTLAFSFRLRRHLQGGQR
ncbi:MAG: glycosyltransferase family 2 protein [Polymorphobacter sp.]